MRLGVAVTPGEDLDVRCGYRDRAAIPCCRSQFRSFRAEVVRARSRALVDRHPLGDEPDWGWWPTVTPTGTQARATADELGNAGPKCTPSATSLARSFRR